MTKSLSSKDSNNHPTVLVIAGLDPTGGAGVSADIETLTNLNVHALPIVTCLTVQDTQNVKQVVSTEPQLIQQQIELLAKDISFDAIKLGLLSSVGIINLVSEILQTQPKIPIIFDPILKAGGGANLANNSKDDIIKAMREKIIPFATIITPNSLEARSLTDKSSIDE